jgi:two-component system, NtrC family, sensor kinase
MEGAAYYRSLNRKMVLIMVLVSFAPLILITAIIGYSFHTSYRGKVIDHLKEVVLKHEQNIDGFLHEKLLEIGVLAYANGVEQLSKEDFLQQRLASLQQVYGSVFVDLGVVDEHGAQLAYAGPFRLAKANYSEADWFKQAIRSNYYISDVFLGLRNQPHFIVAVRQETAGMKWILRATIDFVAFNNVVENIHIGETGLAFILNRAGEFQTKPRLEPTANKDFFIDFFKKSQRDETNIPMGQDYWVSESTLTAKRVGEDRVIVAERESATGRGYIYVMTPLKSGEWILVYQQETADAFSDLYHTRNLAIAIFFVGGLAIMVKSYLLSKRMVYRIERSDQEKEMMNEQVIEAGKLASVGELAAGIAHEINNPVAVMVEEAGWIEDLLDESDCQNQENTEELRRALTQIKTQGARCKDITHKLLSFARKTDPKVREVQLNDILDEIISLSEQRARYSNVKINKNLFAGLPTVFASPSELQQVFLNLINNAIDAIGPNGGNVEITTRVDDHHVVVDVGDTGQGIPKANLVRIFDPFFTTKPVGKGTGLGLSICYGIIKKLGGDITVNSSVGLGTTFHLHFPSTTDDGGRPQRL